MRLGTGNARLPVSRLGSGTATLCAAALPSAAFDNGCNRALPLMGGKLLPPASALPAAAPSPLLMGARAGSPLAAVLFLHLLASLLVLLLLLLLMSLPLAASTAAVWPETELLYVAAGGSGLLLSLSQLGWRDSSPPTVLVLVRGASRPGLLLDAPAVVVAGLIVFA